MINHMEMLSFSFYLFFIFFTPTTSKDNICNPSSCLPFEPPVRFPFHLSGGQPDFCGYPGFTLFCNNNQTSLNLPTGDVIIKEISYPQQTILINPQFCEPNRISNFSLVDTPFNHTVQSSYTFFNCTSNPFLPFYPGVPFVCLSGADYTVFVLPTQFSYKMSNCRNISTIMIPVRDESGEYYSGQELELRWYMPECFSCESNGGTCGTLPGHPNDVICLTANEGSSHGLSTKAKYGIIIGLGIPGMLFIIGLVYFTSERSRILEQRTNVSLIPLAPQPTQIMGLDRSTIESYPKTIHAKLAKPNEGTCPICLSDYQPEEEVRTIPDCNHYFHVQCVDEWLSLNATCPVCRNNQNTIPC